MTEMLSLQKSDYWGWSGQEPKDAWDLWLFVRVFVAWLTVVGCLDQRSDFTPANEPQTNAY